MSASKANQEKADKNDEKSLKGAYASVLLVGGFIALLWFGIWGLYMFRV